MKNLYIVIGVFFFTVGSAFGWNSFGHMTVAGIAYDHLTPTVRTKVNALLKLHPLYKKWVTNVSSQDRPKVAFMMAATWPDIIKKTDSGYQNDGNRPNGPEAARNIGYADKLMHRYWHYIDMPFSPDGTPLINPETPNAKTQIAMFRETLKDPHATDELKSYDLVWLLHLVGDVHQPLHATSRFDTEQPNGDNGGNLVTLCAKPCKNELHAFWDGVLGTSVRPTDASKRAKKLKAVDSHLAAVTDEAIWIDESLQAAKDVVYVSPVGIGEGPFTLDASYKTRAREVSEKRVALAGVRLANLLNELFK